MTNGNTISSNKKLQGQLKCHLNGLYNNLSNIMGSTCGNETNKTSIGGKPAPFCIEKAIHNIMFIKHHMKRQDEFDAVSFPKNSKKKIFHSFNIQQRKQILNLQTISCYMSLSLLVMWFL